MMRLTSTAFQDGQPIPVAYTCDGADSPPPLEISEVPAGTASLELRVTDPDAPGGTFIHWIKRGIPPDSSDLSGGEEDNNSAGKSGWFPPCPPSGVHRYIFEVRALDGQGNVLASVRLIGTYGR